MRYLLGEIHYNVKPSCLAVHRTSCGKAKRELHGVQHCCSIGTSPVLSWLLLMLAALLGISQCGQHLVHHTSKNFGQRLILS